MLCGRSDGEEKPELEHSFSDFYLFKIVTILAQSIKSKKYKLNARKILRFYIEIKTFTIHTTEYLYNFKLLGWATRQHLFSVHSYFQLVLLK